MMASLHEPESAQRKLKIDEVEEVLYDITLLETKMETYLETAKRPRLVAVDSFLDATMITAPPCNKPTTSAKDTPDDTPVAEEEQHYLS
jgi:predicted RNase H-like nuclease